MKTLDLKIYHFKNVLKMLPGKVYGHYTDDGCACADPESFIRGGPTLTLFFLFVFFLFFFLLFF